VIFSKINPVLHFHVVTSGQRASWAITGIASFTNLRHHIPLPMHKRNSDDLIPTAACDPKQTSYCARIVLSE
jgi:hypothetical protein